MPTLVRPDYVTNGNDSHWLSNPEEPLTGFDRIIGIENAERTMRTRLGLVQVEDRLAGEDGLPGNRFNRRILQRVAVGNRQYAGELWRDSVVSMCESAPGGFLMGASGPVNVSGACEPLKAWNLRDDLDSNGAILFRRFVSQVLNEFTALPTGLQGGVLLGSETIWTTQFSVDDPVHTPSGLNTANPVVQGALADAVSDLEGAGIPLDAPLRGHQYENRGGEDIPIHGGPGSVGVFNAINVSWDPEKDGYGDVEHGSSFMMAAQFVDGRCPVQAGTFVTYSQTENQRSKHAADYTRAYLAEAVEQGAFLPGGAETEDALDQAGFRPLGANCSTCLPLRRSLPWANEGVRAATSQGRGAAWAAGACRPARGAGRRAERPWGAGGRVRGRDRARDGPPDAGDQPDPDRGAPPRPRQGLDPAATSSTSRARSPRPSGT